MNTCRSEQQEIRWPVEKADDASAQMELELQ